MEKCPCLKCTKARTDLDPGETMLGPGQLIAPTLRHQGFSIIRTPKEQE
jgi:hypothetical protein